MQLFFFFLISKKRTSASSEILGFQPFQKLGEKVNFINSSFLFPEEEIHSRRCVYPARSRASLRRDYLLYGSQS